MATIKGYILLIRAHFENVLCYEINIFEYLYDMGISKGSNNIYNQYLSISYAKIASKVDLQGLY